MLRHLRCVWLTVLLLVAEARAARFIPRGAGCQRNKPPCRGERLWRRLVQHVDKDIEGDFSGKDEERITVGPEDLAKIKETGEYGCILKQMHEFYAKVLEVGENKKGEKFRDLRAARKRLEGCQLKVHCPRMCKKIKDEVKKTKMRKVKNVGDLSARELAQFQIKRLQQVKKQLSKHNRTWEKAVIELKLLQYYESNREVTVSCGG